MNKEEFIKELEKITISEPGTLKLDSELKDVPGWDSMAILSYIALIDEKMKKRVPADKINQCKNVLDLLKLATDDL